MFYLINFKIIFLQVSIQVNSYIFKLQNSKYSDRTLNQGIRSFCNVIKKTVSKKEESQTR